MGQLAALDLSAGRGRGRARDAQRTTKTIVVDGKRRKRTTSRYEGPRVYDLRHTFASLIAAEHRTASYIAEQLGHSAEMTVRTYTHVIDEYRDREAIDAEAEIRAARGLYPSRTLEGGGDRAARVA